MNKQSDAVAVNFLKNESKPTTVKEKQEYFMKYLFLHPEKSLNLIAEEHNYNIKDLIRILQTR